MFSKDSAIILRPAAGLTSTLLEKHSLISATYKVIQRIYRKLVHHRHQPIIIPTAGARASLMDYTYRERAITHHAGPVRIVRCTRVGTNGLTCLPKHRGVGDDKFLVTYYDRPKLLNFRDRKPKHIDRGAIELLKKISSVSTNYMHNHIYPRMDSGGGGEVSCGVRDSLVWCPGQSRVVSGTK
jgi:hypothetical protein